MNRALSILKTVRARVRAGAGTLRPFAAEIAISLAALSGWALLTASLASLLPHAGSHALWLASTGLLLVSLCGWKFLRKMATDGLYALTRKHNG